MPTYSGANDVVQRQLTVLLTRIEDRMQADCLAYFGIIVDAIKVAQNLLNQNLPPAFERRLCRFPKAWFRYGSSSTSQSRFIISRLVCEWSEVTLLGLNRDIEGGPPARWFGPWLP